jgi:hypothetical protein
VAEDFSRERKTGVVAALFAVAQEKSITECNKA